MRAIGRPGVVILAGGEATRLPNKLALEAGALPLIVRVYENVGAGRETFVAAKSTFERAVDADLRAPLVIDRWSKRGPLGGLLTTLALMQAPFVFAVAGDAPFLDEVFLQTLVTQWRAGDEAVVPAHEVEGKLRLEPLAALYDRLAFLREGAPVLRSGRGALRLVIDRLKTRLVPLHDPEVLTNVNTPADYAALRLKLK